MYTKQNDFGVKYAQFMAIDNFRDLGGIETTDGRTVCDGKIFRSGALFNLSQSEKDELDKLSIKHVFDFRGFDEMEYQPDYVPQGAIYHALPVIDANDRVIIKTEDIKEMFNRAKLSDAVEVSAQMLRWYKQFPFNNGAYAEMFKAMDDGDVILFHCTAGKDRTGIASMLILLALGADYPTCQKDYLLSNVYRKDANRKIMESLSDVKLFWLLKPFIRLALQCKVKYVNASHDEIFKKYATIEEYFEKEYGADANRIANWRKLYTQNKQ